MPKSSYDSIAREYYSDGHVTSRNFDSTTHSALKEMPFAFPTHGLVLDLGAGRGRVKEYLGVPPSRTVQLDNSDSMLGLPEREDCLLKVLADACSIPLASQQFSTVTGFLIDPF